MSQLFDKDGGVVPVTILQAGSVVVTQMKTKEKDGYEAVQVGIGNRKKTPKSVLGQAKGTMLEKSGIRRLKEFRGVFEGKRGDVIDVGIFTEGDKVQVTGISKGKGFQGVVKRHGFHGAPKTHGTKHAHRQPGSIGSTGPQRVLKGQRMAGRTGGKKTTIKKLTVVRVDKENNLLYVKGAVPGNRKGFVEIKGL